ncbi:hypothetical protein DV096_00315 [Bradymonadaceae bacterium TMQ3]|uniref:Uncharacterized protein n=1 Tax=Lujinxingia sediminis TaxID=2480984 RepID=A0ABY0CYE9_9DELT|nr:hypothetical protein [Lujinxingia sediminis]RDV39051.1 hypothetical protein DV096_00315 [Bradymonadaceae bacterium TMQ3]RVU48902.1 hypothetical protein EA187_05605 [Lujinxingia sediminis]TXC78196.1 hypothetical protein FRC91_05570 [Bradymonadales bacterium TMQ1]
MQGETIEVQPQPQLAALGLMIFLIGALALSLWPASAPASAVNPPPVQVAGSATDGERASVEAMFQAR